MLTELRTKYLTNQIERLKGKLKNASQYDKKRDGYGKGKIENRPELNRDGLQDVRDAIKRYEAELKAG